MTLASLIMLFPLIFMISSSFKTEAELLSSELSLIPKNFTTQNYPTAMLYGNWPLYFWNSFYVTFITVVISLFINSLAGYAFARLKFKGRNLLFFIALIGMMVPQQVTMIPLFVMLKNFPFAGGNNIFGSGGKGLINTYWGMILPYSAGAFGVFLFRQFFMNFPSSLDDAAKIDGLSRFGTFTKIYIPLSIPCFATLAVTKSNQVWSEYLWPLIVSTQEKMKTVQLALTLFQSEMDVQWNLLMAATTLITLPLIILFMFAQKYYIEGITVTGMK